MASKNTDIIEQLADTICGNLVATSTKNGKETAPNDKTYSSIIIGLNRKFTDNVSEDEQSEIIEKFSIPETVEEGEDNYYTFKINGAYYCKSQYGDFMLYDKIMVYVPNDDWSRMYFDYSPDSDKFSGYGTDLPNAIVSVEEPGGNNPVEGDIWITVNERNVNAFNEVSVNNFVSIYSYDVIDEDSPLMWKKHNCKLSSGEPSNKRENDFWIKTNSKDTAVKLYKCIYKTKEDPETGESHRELTWREIYPEYEDDVVPSIYVDIYPAVKPNDFWIEIDAYETINIVAFWRYELNEEENKYEYVKQYNVNSGGSFNYIVSNDIPGEEAAEGDLWLFVNYRTVFTSLLGKDIKGLYRYTKQTSDDEESEIMIWEPISYICQEEEPEGVTDGLWIRTEDTYNNGFNRLKEIYEYSEESESWECIYPDPESVNLSIETSAPPSDGTFLFHVDSLHSDKSSFNNNPVLTRLNDIYVYRKSSGNGEWIPVYRSSVTPVNGYTDGSQSYQSFFGNTGSVILTPASDNILIDDEYGSGHNVEYGRENDMRSCSNVLLGGLRNKVSNVQHSIVSGISNTMTYGQDSIVIGSGIDLSTSNVTESIISGLTIKATGIRIQRSIISGDSHEITGGVSDCLIVGLGHKISEYTSSGKLICGMHAIVGSDLGTVHFIVGGSGSLSTGDNAFTVDDYGSAIARGDVTARSFITAGGDYTETYEWLDGNPDNEDRRGLFVTLDGEYIKFANFDDDYILGVVSATPSISGDTYDTYWKGKFKRDVFGALILNEKGHPILSDDYDKTQEYIPQSKRPEKAKIGTEGKLVVVDDGTCVVNKYCKPSINGIGSYTDDKSYYRVIKRIDATHVKVVLK